MFHSKIVWFSKSDLKKDILEWHQRNGRLRIYENSVLYKSYENTGKKKKKIATINFFKTLEIN